MPKKQETGPKDPGPWLTREVEIAAVPTKKKQCALCELWFSVDNLTGVASWKAVLEKKASFGDEHAKAKLSDPMTSHSRLYSGVPLCCFCTQLIVPEDVPDFPDWEQECVVSSTSRPTTSQNSFKPKMKALPM